MCGVGTVTYPYERIAADLRAKILDGHLAPGDPLPSANEVAADYRTTRNTARRAIELLHADGLIDMRQGARPRVRITPVVHVWGNGADWRRHRDAGRPGFDATVAEHGLMPRQEILNIQDPATAPARIAARLGLDGDEEIVIRYVRQFADDIPARLVKMHFPAAWASGTALADRKRIRGGVAGYIENAAGPVRQHLATSSVVVGARVPTTEEKQLLQLGRGAIVLEATRTFLDGDGQPVYVQEEVADAAQHRYQFRVDL